MAIANAVGTHHNNYEPLIHYHVASANTLESQIRAENETKYRAHLALKVIEKIKKRWGVNNS
jgi:hypothetical protein